MRPEVYAVSQKNVRICGGVTCIPLVWCKLKSNVVIVYLVISSHYTLLPLPHVDVGNSPDKLRHPRSDAYSEQQVLLNKQHIWCGRAYLDCYQLLHITAIGNSRLGLDQG